AGGHERVERLRMSDISLSSHSPDTGPSLSPRLHPPRYFLTTVTLTGWARFISFAPIRPLPEPHALLERTSLLRALAHQLHRCGRQLEDHPVSSSSWSAP